MNTIANLFSGNIAYAFAWTMVHSLWQCSLIALVLAASLRITRTHSPGLRHIQGIFALLVCVAVSSMTFFHYYDNAAAATTTLRALGPGINVSYAGTLWEQFYVTLNSSVHYIVLIWMLGFTFQCYRYASDFIRAFRLKTRGCEIVSPAWSTRFNALAERIGLAKRVVVKNSRYATSSCVIGHFKPVILLPIGLLTSLSSDQAEAVILHELAHIKRNDYLINAVQCVVRLLYFFNPAVLWISSKVDIERENACDDIAVQYCASPAVYARSLASVSEMELNRSGALAVNSNRYQILPRIKRLFDTSPGISKGMEKLVSAVCVCFVVLTMNVGAEPLNLLKMNAAQNEREQTEMQVPASAAVTAEPAIAAAELENDKEIDRTPAESAHDDIDLPEAPSIDLREHSLDTTVKASPEMDYAIKSTLTKFSTGSSRPNRTLTIAQNDSMDAAMRETDSPEAESEGSLEPMHTPEFDQFFIASNANIPLTRKLYITEPTVEFADIWLKRFSTETSARYKETIKKEYGRALAANFKAVLGKSDWEIVNSPLPEALRLSIRLFDLYVFAPESTGLKQTIVATAGQAGLELVFTTPSDRPFMKVVDYRQTAQSAGSPFVANKATNYHYFDKLMRNWAEDTSVYIENVMSIVETQRGT